MVIMVFRISTGDGVNGRGVRRSRETTTSGELEASADLSLLRQVSRPGPLVYVICGINHADTHQSIAHARKGRVSPGEGPREDDATYDPDDGCEKRCKTGF